MKFNTSPDFVSDVPVSQLEKSKRYHEICRNIRYFKAIGGRNFRREIKTPGDPLIHLESIKAGINLSWATGELSLKFMTSSEQTELIKNTQRFLTLE